MNLARKPLSLAILAAVLTLPVGHTRTTYTLRAHVPGLPTQVSCYGDMTEISSQTFSYDGKYGWDRTPQTAVIPTAATCVKSVVRGGTAAYYRQQVASLLKKLRYNSSLRPSRDRKWINASSLNQYNALSRSDFSSSIWLVVRQAKYACIPPSDFARAV